MNIQSLWPVEATLTTREGAPAFNDGINKFVNKKWPVYKVKNTSSPSFFILFFYNCICLRT